MKVNGKPYRTIFLKEGDPSIVQIIDQCKLPHEFSIIDLHDVYETADVIRQMNVRGAGLIGATAGYGMYLAAMNAPTDDQFDDYLRKAAEMLNETRPTAVNLKWATGRQLKSIAGGGSIHDKIQIALKTAIDIANEDAAYCKKIGEHGVKLIEKISRQKGGKPVNILTHCNAGWLAFVDHGSATSPIYEAFDRGINIHVWVDETRPRNQGATLTAWELGQHGVPHTLIPDNTGGHLMQHGMVDLVIVGTDRTTRTGDVANKIGTYLKALAAQDNGVPFYVALPSSSFDWEIRDGVKEIPIEERGSEEVKYVKGYSNNGWEKVLIAPIESPAANYGFDVTPARLVSGLITERGICCANEVEILKLFPEKQLV